VEEGAWCIVECNSRSDFTAIHGELQESKQTNFRGHVSEKVIIKSCGRYCPKANFEWNCPTEIVVDVEPRYFSFLQSGKEGAQRSTVLKSRVFNLANKVVSDGNCPTIKFELKSKVESEDNKPSSVAFSRRLLVRLTAVIRPLSRRRLPTTTAHCTPNQVQTGSIVSQLAVFAHKPPFVL
jgi:hypothetical protein